jgi:hypothetical protein
LAALPFLAICTIASPADAVCIIRIDPQASVAGAGNRPTLHRCPQPRRSGAVPTPRMATPAPQDVARAARQPAAPAIRGRSERDVLIARSIGQGYVGFRKVYRGQRYTGFEGTYRGQRYLGFKKVYSGPRYPSDLYDSGGRWSF